MAHRSSSWNDPSQYGRSRLSAVQEEYSLSQASQYQFRPDASTFRPISKTPAAVGYDTFEPTNPPDSPYYPLPTTPFMPPDTPQLGTFPSPPPGQTVPEPTPTLTSVAQPTSKNNSPAKLFTGLGMIWAPGPNEINFGQNRKQSEVTQDNLQTVFDAPRPRSRSDAFHMASSHGHSYTAPNSTTPSKKDSTGSSPARFAEIHHPSPARQPSQMRNVVSPSSTVGRATPGGVPLSRDIKLAESGYPLAPKASSAKNLAEFIRSGGLEAAVPTQGIQSGATATLPRGPMGKGFQKPMPGGPQQMMPTSSHIVDAPPDPLVEEWKRNRGPTWQDVISNLAFVESSRAAIHTNYGVVKLSDIPYTTTKPEVVALIGERAPMVQMPRGSGTYAIHIIMERSTAKSMDAYVELETPEAALQVVARLEHHGRPMIQARRVTARPSSQEALMKDMFPRAKCVRWEGPNPVIEERKDLWTSGFQGFVSSEELVMTVKVAQNPQRSRFAIKHQQRTYESMISLMFKYPWHAVDSYTIHERDLIFKTTRDQLITLTAKLQREGVNPPLDAALLQELLDAGLKCPGFSESQRASLIDAVQGCALTRIYVTPIAHYWPFEVLRRKDGVSDALVFYYTTLLRQASAPTVTSLAQMSAMNGNNGPANVKNPHFGHFAIPWPQNKNEMTMAQAAKLEWDCIEQALRKVIKK